MAPPVSVAPTRQSAGSVLTGHTDPADAAGSELLLSASQAAVSTALQLEPPSEVEYPFPAARAAHGHPLPGVRHPPHPERN